MDTGRAFGLRSVAGQAAKTLLEPLRGTVSLCVANLDTDYTNVAANNYLMSYGATLPPYNLNLALTSSLPWGFDLSLNMQMTSQNPFTATTNGVDLSGTGVSSSTPLPGLQYSCLNLTCGKSDLTKAVAAFNSTYAGTKALTAPLSRPTKYPRITSWAIRPSTRTFV